MRCNELLRELYWESLRAPSHRENFRRNPSYKRNRMRQLFGRTKAERDANKRKYLKEIAEYKVQREIDIEQEEQ